MNTPTMNKTMTRDEAIRKLTLLEENIINDMCSSFFRVCDKGKIELSDEDKSFFEKEIRRIIYRFNSELNTCPKRSRPKDDSNYIDLISALISKELCPQLFKRLHRNEGNG